MKKTQRDIILNLLHENEKVNSYDLTYKYSIKQAPTRIWELKSIGHNIISSPIKQDGSIDYTLMDLPIPVQTRQESQPKRPFRWKFVGNTAFKVFL